MPRGDALGMVSYLPEKDQMNLTRLQMLAHIDVCMGGRVAEEMIFGREEVTTGASSDLQQATNMARNMITKYGMSEALGPMYHSREELDNLSPATREAVEAEVKAYVSRAETNARKLLNSHKEELHRLARGLLEHETLTKHEIDELLAGREIRVGEGKGSKATRAARAATEAAAKKKGQKGAEAAVAATARCAGGEGAS